MTIEIEQHEIYGKRSLYKDRMLRATRPWIPEVPLYCAVCWRCGDELIAAVDSMGQWWLLDPTPCEVGTLGGVLLNNSRVLCQINMGEYGWVPHARICPAGGYAHPDEFDFHGLINAPFRRWW